MIIAFTGRKKHGKSTATELAQKILRNRGKQSSCMAFAEPLRDIGRIMGFTYEEMNDPEMKELPSAMWGKSWRKFSTWLGTDCIRNHWCKTAWIKLLENSLENDGDDIIFVTDVRYNNEAKMLKKFEGTVIINIERPSLVKWWHRFIPKHSSECGVNKRHIDCTIKNDSTLDELSVKILEAMEKHKII